MGVIHSLQPRLLHTQHNWSPQGSSVCLLVLHQVSCGTALNTCYIIMSFIVCSTEQSVGPGLGEDLLDLILREGTLDDLPLPSENRSSPDPVLELFGMPVKCSSPIHSPPDPQALPIVPQAPPLDTCTLPTDSLDLLLSSQSQLSEVDHYLNNDDQFWSNHCSPSNSSAVSSVPSPQQLNGPLSPPQIDNVTISPSPQQCSTIPSELVEQYGCLHDHTYAAMEPQCVNEEEKYLEKRRKNNLASQVSRAKRKRKYSTMFARLDDLEEENKRLKEEISAAEIEATKLKKLIIQKLNTNT